MVCRILNLWPGVEVVHPALEAQRHNHWTSGTIRHPGKSWCLHLRNSVVSSNPALAPPSRGHPSWSTSATPSKLRPHPINTTQVTLSFYIYLLICLSLRPAWALLKTKCPFSNLKTVTSIRYLWPYTKYGFIDFLWLWFLLLWKLISSALGFTIALSLVLPFVQWRFTLHL